MKTEDVMTTSVITVTENQTRQQAARLLSQHRISGLPVLNVHHAVVGVVTEYDVISKEGQTVADIMTHGVISVTPDTDLEEVSHILIHERIKRLPVLDQGRLVGIVSRADLVRELVLHLMYLIGFRNRLVVGFQWFVYFTTFQRGARLITFDNTSYPM